ncbi:uncharacterized protein SRS1_12728 [Sporisorium reilianum f. sp. reilianum]|uniref:Uncharacterized protein n=1 Tax=Sporisorium reilianum f. sp. reilianum TaxID=72559 RepID=A0A2N8U9M5_9BASI|nr:uncharacterized protein SRS1_12728 [Sporisorium reilianum f. sp. reilianum]
MVAARRQRQAQKLQEQQISKALAEAKPANNKVSFDDSDDQDNTGSAQASTSAATPISPARNAQASDDDDSEDDDAPIEVVSNKISRKQATQDSARLKAQEKAEKAKRQEAEKARLQKQKQKEAAQAALTASAITAATEEEEQTSIQTDDEKEDAESDEEEDAGPSNRLDPSLFAQVFSQPVSAPRSILKKRSAEGEADEVARLQKERKLKRKQQRAGGVVKGRDGLPMKLAQDGTVLRALNEPTQSTHKTSFDDQDEDQPEEPLDEMARPTPLDRSVSLPSAKTRAFRKRTLAKTGLPKAKVSAKGSKPKAKKNEDDPLGLNDPAFLPGGEFYHLMNKGDKPKGAKQGRAQEPPSARQSFRGGGIRKDAISVLRSRSRSGPSIGFARSQQDSDDDY